MPRAKREATETTKKFSEMLDSCIKEKMKNDQVTQEEIANAIGISSSQLFDYRNDYKTPTIDTLSKICKYFAVSADYMLTGVRSNNTSIAEATGLSDGAIEFLRYLHRGCSCENDYPASANRQTVSFINRVMELECRQIGFDSDGDPKFQSTLFRLMELYVLSSGATGTMTEGESNISSKLITVSNPTDPNTRELLAVPELYREVLFSRIREYLEHLRKQEEEKHGKH